MNKRVPAVDRRGAGRAFCAAALVFLPGLAMAVFAAGVAYYAAALSGVSAAACAILVGLVMIVCVRGPLYRSGLNLAAGGILKIAIALLGARLSLGDMASLGAGPFIVVAATMAGGLAFSFLAARLLGLSPLFGWIGGMSVAVCGVSAAMTAASILPKSARLDREVLFAAMIVTILSSVAMILYPWIADAAGLGDVETGIFLGATIHDLAQVLGAGYAVSPIAGDVALITKLIRVAMLVPLVLGAALVLMRRAPAEGRIAVPWFLFGFIAVSLLRSFGLIPDAYVAAISQLSSFGFLMAIAAIGMKSRWADFRLCDSRYLILLVGHTLLLAGGSLVLVQFI